MNDNSNRFEDLTVKGFRRLQHIHLELRNLCVLIGANGVGKTSLLDIFGLLAASAEGKLGDRMSDLGGLSSVLTLDRAKHLSLELSMKVPNNNPLAYKLTLGLKGVAYEILEESLAQQRQGYEKPFKHIDSYGENVRYFDLAQNKLVPPTWDYKASESSLAQVPKMFREPEAFRSRLASSTFYHVLNVEPRSPVRLPQPLRPASLPGKDGEDLVSCLFNLREAERDRFEAVEDALKSAFPSFQRMDFPPVAAGTLSMTWKDKNFKHPFYMHQLSEGTLRFLWLATLLQSPGLTAVTLLDEPEVSLHPELLNLLAGLMREASSRTQLIVATHSDRLIRALQPQEVVVCDLLDDSTGDLKWADTMNLEQWLSEYTLDQVWSMGRLGGRS